jgi:hypothetical protein
LDPYERRDAHGLAHSARVRLVRRTRPGIAVIPATVADGGRGKRAAMTVSRRLSHRGVRDAIPPGHAVSLSRDCGNALLLRSAGFQRLDSPILRAAAPWALELRAIFDVRGILFQRKRVTHRYQPMPADGACFAAGPLLAHASILHPRRHAVSSVADRVGAERKTALTSSFEKKGRSAAGRDAALPLAETSSAKHRRRKPVAVLRTGPGGAMIRTG